MVSSSVPSRSKATAPTSKTRVAGAPSRHHQRPAFAAAAATAARIAAIVAV